MSIDFEWDEDALRLLHKAPFFVRGLARKRIEKAARKQGLNRITIELVEQVKNQEMKQ